MSQPGLARRVATLVAVAAAYYAAGKLGLSLAFVNASASAVWPPTGIALAALLVLGPGIWPGVLLGAFLVNLTTAGTVATSLGIAAGNTIEALIAAALVRRFASGVRAFDLPQSIFQFAALAGLSTIASATIGVATLALGGLVAKTALGPIWLTWWLGDTTGALVVAPALILWGLESRVSWTRPQWLEAALLGVSLLLACALSFGDVMPAGRHYPLQFLWIPPLLWAACRFTPRESATAVLALSAVAVAGTLRGDGPFALYAPTQSLLLLQAFMGVTSVTILALAAAVSERRRIEIRIRQLNQGLEQRVSDATRRLRATNEELRNQVREREQAAIALERSEARLREAQRVAHIGSWEWDIDRNVVWWTEELHRIYGLDPAQFGASYEHYLERVHPEDREASHSAVQAALGDRKAFSFEHRIVRPDGEILHVFARGRVICDSSGRPVRMVGSGQDMTERKRIEEERASLIREQAAQREAQQANQVKDEFLATLSHELRNPLNAIVGWARLLRDGVLDPAETRRGIEAINRNADLQSQLILDLLDHSRITAGRLELRRQLVGLVPMIEHAIEGVKPAARAKDIGIIARLEDAGASVFGDPDRLQQIVANLLSNAIRFNLPGGRVDVALSREGDSAVIRVQDDGPGIEPGLLPHVFDRFRSGDSTPSRRQGGLGLGLAIVRHLVDLHGGSVSAANRPTGGAAFEVRLPLSGTQPREAANGHPGDARHENATAADPLRGLHVLVAEDDADSREALRLLLVSRGATVDTASSTAEALSAFDLRPPDVLVSDIGMPEENGYDLVRAVRERPVERGGGVAAIALTAYASAEDARCAIRAGYQVHLAKPVESSQLVRIIERLARPVASRA